MKRAGANVVVFLGPSCPAVTAGERVTADFLPPARRGDFYRLLASDVDIIVLIDGVFHRQPSVGHHEILAAVDEGITVIGASSMGALRAAELHDLGVDGFGTVFEWYRDGYIDGDDEVALRHAGAEHQYRASSEPLVNIRATLLAAVDAGCITAPESDALILEAQATFYPDRSWGCLLEGMTVSGWPSHRREALTIFVRTSYVDVKRQDACGAFEYACELAANGRGRRASPDRDRYLLPTDFARFTSRLFTDRKGRAVDGHVLGSAIDAADLLTVRQHVATRWISLRWAADRHVRFAANEVAAIERRLRSAHERDEHGFLHRNSLAACEYAGWVRRQARFEWLAGRGATDFGLSWSERDALLDSRLFPSDATAVRSAKAFLIDWGHTHGLTAPEREQSLLRASWQAHGDLPSVDESLVGDLALAHWLTVTAPEAIGFWADTRTNLILELQATDQLAEVLQA